MIQSKIKTWADDLSMLEGHERLSYLVDLARRATTLPSELRTDERLVPGCISKIWVEVGLKEDGINIYYDSDALIPKGITTIVCDIFTGSNKEEALSMKHSQLAQHLHMTPETLSRMFKKLVTLELVEKTSNGYIITNREGLHVLFE